MSNKLCRHGLSTGLCLTVARLLTVALLLLAPAIVSRGSEEPAPPGSSLEAFSALYAQVMKAVADGSQPETAGPEAEDVRFAVERDLIRSDAEIEVGKLEVARFTGARQQEALDRLLDAAAARERRVCVAIRQLEELAGMTAQLSAAAPAAAGPAAAEMTEQPAEANQGKFSLTFEAEDLVENPDS